MEPVSLRKRAGSQKRALESALRYLWDVFSTPAPSGRDVLVLLSSCLVCAILTGVLLHHWLSETLKYEQPASVWSSCVYAVTVFLLSFLCHPLRCVFCMILPTVCTKQGRKLLLSAAFMILLLNVVPNITANVSAAARLLKCTAEGLTRTLLNSSDPFNAARRDIFGEALKVWTQDKGVFTNIRKLDHFTRIDVSEVKSVFANVIAQIEANLSQTRSLLKEYKVLSNRILAAIFVALLIIESARYLKSYLTSAKFDNKKAPQDGGKKQSEAQMSIPVCRITRQECTSCFLSMVPVTLYFSAIALTVALDHVVYQILQMFAPWFLDFPATTASISVNYKVTQFFSAVCVFTSQCRRQELLNFHRDYRWTFDPDPSLCQVSASPPSTGVTVLLVALWLLSYFLVFLEVYARRLRRSICSAFFREQEERRVTYSDRKRRDEQRRTEPTF